ncbi:hypothetical protein IGI04_042892 [Brassica rapa subsp. trilocularis]|uniref:Retrotransposon gag domain-containing protein n=1 Tax=Brassica rapa subsp. trilocularis TaxID=1813537 RepID=A0ABQ7KJZ4_BRACM|nr:hypothetical protein IGI04_042892 [Brassica rapa subsp. trilocularis]
MDSYGRPVCADGHTRTATDVMCVLTDTHGRPFWLDRTHSFRISPNPGMKSVKENATKQPAFANLESVFVRKQCCNSGQSASREEAVEKRKPRRSMQHSAHRSMEIPDRGPCIFCDCIYFRYIHISTRAMKRGFLGPLRKEPAGLCTIRKSKREVSIDTLQAASIDSIHHQSIDTIHPTTNKSSNNTVHRDTIHRGTVHPGTVHHNTIHPSTVHHDTIHRDTIYLPSIDTIQIPSIDTIHVPSIDTVHPNTVHRDTIHCDTIHIPSIDTIHVLSIDTVHPVSVDTIHLPSIDTVHILSLDTVHRDTVHPNTVYRDTVHRDTVPPMPNTTYGETEKVEALIGSVIPDVIAVAETNTFNLTSQWYDSGSENPFNGLPHEDPKDLIKRLEELVSANKHNEIPADHIICKIFPYCLSRDPFSWFSKLQPRSLTCWEDIKEAFIGKFFSEAVATRSNRLDYMIDKMIKDREKGIMISMSQILDFVYSEKNGDIGTPTTHVKQPDIQVHHADESKQKEEVNREKLVNHDTIEDDEYHVSGEQSKVEEADTKDPTSASIDNSNSESIDIRTSETIDTDICHRSIPSTIPDATTLYFRTGRPKAIRDYNSPEDAYAKRSALRHPTSHLETFVDLASTIKCNEVFEDYYLCKLFSYSLAGETTYWFRKLPLGSLTTWNDIRYAFLNKFLDDAAANLEIEIRSMLEYMVEDDEQHESGKLSTIEVADISDTSSSSIDTLTITSIVTPTSSSINPSTSEMIDTDFCHRSIPLEIPERSSCPQDIANSTQKSIDETSCDLTSDVDKVTLKDFLELEEWLRHKLDDQPASGKGLENSLKADDIDRINLMRSIDTHPTTSIYSRRYMIEPELVGRKEHTSGASHLAVPEHLRPPICAEEAVGICKRVKRIHDPVKVMVPCAVFEVESPIPPDKGVYLSSYIEVLNDQYHVEAYQRGLRFRDEVDEGPAGAPSSDISKSELIDTNTSSSIDTDQIPSIDTRRESEQNEYELCGNIFYGDTTTHSDKSEGKKWRNWKKK